MNKERITVSKKKICIWDPKERWRESSWEGWESQRGSGKEPDVNFAIADCKSDKVFDVTLVHLLSRSPPLLAQWMDDHEWWDGIFPIPTSPLGKSRYSCPVLANHFAINLAIIGPWTNGFLHLAAEMFWQAWTPRWTAWVSWGKLFYCVEDLRWTPVQ
jgi:hypothetical protein